MNPREADIVVVKIGYLVPELYEMQADWIMALTPGGVDQNLERLGYERINRPMLPLDEDMIDPDLSARLVRSSDQLEQSYIATDYAGFWPRITLSSLRID